MGVKIDDIPEEKAAEIIAEWVTTGDPQVAGPAPLYPSRQGGSDLHAVGSPSKQVTRRLLVGPPVSRHPFKSKIVVTVNPEFLVATQKDPEFQKILNRADLSVPDGVGLKLFAGLENRVTGVDLLLKLCQLAAAKGWTVGLFGGEEGVAKKAKTKLEERFPGLKVAWAVDGREADEERNNEELIRKNGEVDLLFVALGQVKQERFLEALRTAGVYKVGMGVGGAFDYLSGRVTRAPKFLRLAGLEWAYRLAHQPQRLGRIVNAVVVFPLQLAIKKGTSKRV